MMVFDDKKILAAGVALPLLAIFKNGKAETTLVNKIFELLSFHSLASTLA